MAERFENILDECIERLLQGESVEQCLERYPEHAVQLEPLLRVAKATRETSSVEPRPEFKAQARYQIESLLHAKGQKAGPRRLPLVSWVPRWAVVVAAVFLVILLAGSGTVAASSSSLPGDTLYPVKTATERVWLSLTFSDTARARLQAKFADRRVAEMARMAERGYTEGMEELAARFDAHLKKVEELAARIRQADPEDETKIAALREILYRNMARDEAVLQAAQERALLRGRPAVERAIQLAKSRLMETYRGALGALDSQQAGQGSVNGGSGESGGWQESGQLGFQKGQTSLLAPGLQGELDGSGDVVSNSQVLTAESQHITGMGRRVY